MKKYNVYIYDSESGCNQPILVECKSKTEARAIGNKYIRLWRLVNGTVKSIEEICEHR